ncbi:MAG: penicillin-binding protein [Actinomycetaceae bacterium]|nr:penicillin-binding protein [Actinomycetaceae bacterium]
MNTNNSSSTPHSSGHQGFPKLNSIYNSGAHNKNSLPSSRTSSNHTSHSSSHGDPLMNNLRNAYSAKNSHGKSSRKPPSSSRKKTTTSAKTTHKKTSASPTHKRNNTKPNAKTKKKKRRFNYPRQGLGPIRRWLPSWRFIFGTIFAGIAAIFSMLGVLYYSLDIPDPDAIALAQKTTVYYSDGTKEIGNIGDFDRHSVELENISIHAQHAVISSEDRTFYSNNGIDLKGIARAAYNNIRGNARQGASTLTQQYVERYYLGQTTSYTGKLKEALLALKIDRNQSKEKTLEDYLNTIYFGRGAYGIESAAQKYFGHSAKDLTISESAMIAGIIPAPSTWDPAKNPEKALQRYQRTLALMAQEGYITQQEADSLKDTPPETQEWQSSSNLKGTDGYILATVKQELINSGKFTEDTINQGGYKIITSIDPDLQQKAVDAVNNLPDSRPEGNQVGLVSEDPKTGEVKALYGGADYSQRQRSTATQDRAQAGSTFKVFTLAAALEQNISLKSTYSGKASITIEGETISNSGNVNYGQVSLLTATKYSINTAYVALNQKIGPASTKAAAISAGIPENAPGLENNVGNTLGSASVTAYEMAGAYSIFANNGEKKQIHIVRSVTDHQGDTIYSGQSAGERVFSEKTAQTVNYALQSVTQKGGSGENAQKLGRTVAGKTGTSSGPWSAWFCGYTPSLVTVVNMYQIGPRGEEQVITSFGKYKNEPIYGGTYPTDIWLDFMSEAVKKYDDEKFASNLITQENKSSNGSGKKTSQPSASASTQTDGNTPQTTTDDDKKEDTVDTTPHNPANPPNNNNDVADNTDNNNNLPDTGTNGRRPDAGTRPDNMMPY